MNKDVTMNFYIYAGSFQKGSRTVLVSDEPNLHLRLCGDFEMTFKKFHVGQKLDEQLSQDFIRSDFYKKALSFNIYSLRKWELLKACKAREWLLMRRNSVVYVVRSVQVSVTFVHVLKFVPLMA